ncbi:uncharacterized protein LOC119980837 [Tripterygium wilfordii]|uniref:uncharacterized protein LOC119980837 n=1 Tax=Tripterygium wilfordii TaxID=458696 RepID=UPI0018F7F396|nr:uncharacterized protein LOC119980837 [Tripterygium wilfordii]
MIIPYVLKTLSTDQKGLYHTSFKVPDVFGVFRFKIECHRFGYSCLSVSKQLLLDFYCPSSIHSVLSTSEVEENLSGKISSCVTRILYIGNLPGDIRERKVEGFVIQGDATQLIIHVVFVIYSYRLKLT